MTQAMGSAPVVDASALAAEERRPPVLREVPDQESELKLANTIAAICLVAATLGNANATYIDSHNREWRELSDTLRIQSFNQIDTGGIDGCSAATGLCSGHLGGTGGPRLDGWIWATRLEVLEMFIDVGVPAAVATGLGNLREVNAPWADALVDTDVGTADDGAFLGRESTSAPGTFVLAGITRTVLPTSEPRHFLPLVFDRIDSTAEDLLLPSANAPHSLENNAGIWLYREVPAPATNWLVAIGIGACLFLRRRSAGS